MDCIGRTYNVFTACKENITNLNIQNHIAYLDKDFVEKNKVKDSFVCRGGFWFSIFTPSIQPYIIKEINDTIYLYNNKKDTRYDNLLSDLNRFKSCLIKPKFVNQQNIIINFNLHNSYSLNDLFTKAENEANLTKNEEEGIQTFRKELYAYKVDFEKNIGEDSRYDFLKHVFLCEFKNIEMILDNFDKIRPEYIFQHWGSLSLNIINFAYDKPALMEASAKINNIIFNFVKKYATPIVCEKLLEQPIQQIFQCLTK